jgi:large subunit ribosomal protein L4e
LVSAIAATGVPALVASKGHLIDKTPEFPLVVSDKVQEIRKTSQAVSFLQNIQAWDDIEKVRATTRQRAGRGKMRNRRTIKKLGPAIIYAKDSGLTSSFRNLPGVETINVQQLNLTRLAPGGHVGRFVIWTESAFRQLDKLYGTWKHASKAKKNYNLPQPKMVNADLSRLLHSKVIQNAIRRRRSVSRCFLQHSLTTKFSNSCVVQMYRSTVTRALRKQNPYRNLLALKKLNPHALVVKKFARKFHAQRTAARAAIRKSQRGEKLTAEERELITKTLGKTNRKAKDLFEQRAKGAAKRKEVLAKKEALAAAKSKK